MKPFRDCFRALLRTLKPLRFKVGVSVLFGLAEVALALLFVWYSKRLVDIATGQDAGGLMRGIILFASILLAQIAVRVGARYWEGWLEVTARNDTRSKVFGRVMRSVWTGKERFHSGDTVNRLEEDIRVVVDFTVVSLPQVVVTICQLIAATIFLFALSSDLAWILIFIMPAAVLGSRLFFRKMRALTTDIRRGDSRVQAHIQENLQHRMLVRTMGGTDEVLDDLDDMQDDVRDLTVTRLNYAAVSRSFLQAGFVAGYAAAFIWSVLGLRDGSVTFGLMTAFLQLVGQVQRPVADITRQIPAFIRALSSEERLLELEEMEQEEEKGAILLPGAPGVRLKGLSFSYPDAAKPVFEGLDYDFAPGSVTAITGSTGSGKSTLIRVMMAMLRPTAGSVELYDPATESSADTRCNFMYVPQGNSLMSGTIKANLLLANPDASEDEMKEALVTAAAGFVFDLPAGLETDCAEVGAGLSEGQAQRIAIARALLRPGGILVLDEATSALDAATELEVLESISGRYRGRKTVICITHRPAATSYADAELKL